MRSLAYKPFLTKEQVEIHTDKTTLALAECEAHPSILGMKYVEISGLCLNSP